MASTRARKAGAATAQVAPTPDTLGEPPAQHVKDPSPPHYLDTPKDEKTETIGSRLRRNKRRRTESSPVEDTPTVPKRAYARKVTTKDEQIDTSPQDAPTTSQPRQQRIARGQTQTKGKAPEAAQSPIELGMQDSAEMAGQGSTPMHQAAYEEHSALHDSAGPDFNTIISDIVNHGETVDNHYVSQGYDAMGMVDTDSFQRLGASLHLKTQSLPILDNLATQILNTLAKSTYQEILLIATKPDSDPGQAYATLKSLFDHTKKVYSIHEPFLSPYQLGLVEAAHIDTIRKANMATFVSSVFGSQDVGFYHLNENFIDTFLIDGHRLLKNQAQLFLDLKTQAYISAATTGERSREEILEDLFPYDLEDRLLRRRPGIKQLAPSEQDFINRARNRRKALLEEPMTPEAIQSLPEKYIWEDFLRDISAYVTKNFEAIAGIAPRKTSRTSRNSNYFTVDQKQQQQNRQQNRAQQARMQNNQARQPQQPQPPYYGHPQDEGRPPAEVSNPQTLSYATNTDDIAGKAARAAHFAMREYGNDQDPEMSQEPKNEGLVPSQNPGQPEHPMHQGQPEIRYHFEHALHPDVPAPPPPQYYHHVPYQHNQQMPQQWQGQMMGVGQLHQSYSDQPLIPYPTQTAPTQVLYERARMAATAKVSPSNRRAGHPSQRRPWTADEENSLMAGLDRVKGPHWSQILAMFGPGGTINEVLKDRNQVQLKDKARNLKLFFLKSQIEVPYYLQFVTGELKTRAPAQAAKNEAKEKGETEEDRAHVEGVIALAGGSMQETDQEMTVMGDQEDHGFQNGEVNCIKNDGEVENDIPIDTQLEGVGVIDSGMNSADAPTDGIEEAPMTILHHEQQLQQLQQPQLTQGNGFPNTRIHGGTGSRPVPPRPMPHEPARSAAIGYPTKDEVLTV